MGRFLRGLFVRALGPSGPRNGSKRNRIPQACPLLSYRPQPRSLGPQGQQAPLVFPSELGRACYEAIYVTYFTMLYVFNAWNNPALFQTGWFVESLLTQTLIIHIIRTAKIPFLESRASTALITTTIIIAVIGITLPFSWLGGFLGFVPLPPAYWIALCLILLSYVILTQFMKTWFIRRFGLS